MSDEGKNNVTTYQRELDILISGERARALLEPVAMQLDLDDESLRPLIEFVLAIRDDNDNRKGAASYAGINHLFSHTKYHRDALLSFVGNVITCPVDEGYDVTKSDAEQTHQPAPHFHPCCKCQNEYECPDIRTVQPFYGLCPECDRKAR